MKNEIDMLNYIYQNAEMGIIGIDDVKTYVSNDDFCNLLCTQRNEYENLLNKASELIQKYDDECKEINKMAKVSSKVMSQVKLKKDNEVSTIAKMMMEGTNKGIIAITEKINKYKLQDDKVSKLALDLKHTLEENIETLEKYL